VKNNNSKNNSCFYEALALFAPVISGVTVLCQLSQSTGYTATNWLSTYTWGVGGSLSATSANNNSVTVTTNVLSMLCNTLILSLLTDQLLCPQGRRELIIKKSAQIFLSDSRFFLYFY